jgi:hypothetical protein
MLGILLNIANFMLLDYCQRMSIDCAGTYCYKMGRGFKFGLRSEQTGETIATVTFTKNSRPIFTRGDNNEK